MSRIEVRGVTKGFPNTAGGYARVLDDLDLTVEAGEVHALLGFSGSGKTTLLRLIAGLEAPDRGAIAFAGGEPRVAMVFQEPRLLPWASVAENLTLALRRMVSDERERARRVAAILELVGLRGCGALLPAQLSGGMAQRAALARALLREPDVLLLDEPLGALDPLTRRRMQDELVRLRAHFPPTTLLVTHEVAEAVRLADRISLLAQGRIQGGFVVRERQGRAARDMEETILQTLFAAVPPSPTGAMT
jgi:sulfonate transport system ATP-binding protein